MTGARRVSVTTAEELCVKHIRPLPESERRRLLALLARDLEEAGATRSLSELAGLSAQAWEGVNAQVCVRELRQGWDDQRGSTS